ncbi:MAG: exo-alpha-sialidase, partial [Planctomycetaceae bacterium]
MAVVMRRLLWLAGVSVLLPSSACMAVAQSNVLFVAVDNPRPQSGCYGAEHIFSPNIDAPAASGRLFERAYCQQAVCKRSRTSLMTGMRPDWTGVTGDHVHFRDNHPNPVTLPRDIRNHGYHTSAIGKIYHGDFPSGTLIHPDHVTGTVALSQYLRGGGLMGYPMRTATHRLTRWVHQDTGKVHATELYDDQRGLIETQNIASTAPDLTANLLPQPGNAFADRFASLPAQREVTQEPSTALDEHSTSFEQSPAGQFTELKTEVGTWKPGVGRTIIDDRHAKTGKQCLQLTGGPHASVTLVVANTVDTTGELTFQAERWTKRAPFSFRIEKNSRSGWQEIYNGDRNVRVGRAFLTHVKVPLGDAEIQQLRFTVTSPPDTGILIDDVRIAPVRPQKIVSVEVVPFTLPALVGVASSPVLELNVKTSGRLNPLALTKFTAAIRGTEGAFEPTLVYVYPADRDGKRPLSSYLTNVAADRVPVRDGFRTYSCRSPIVLAEGDNVIRVACRVNRDVDIDRQIQATLHQVTFSSGETVRPEVLTSSQRMGIAVRNGGDDGVNTYRIPGLATTRRGTLIGVYDVRRRSGGDLPGDIDVGMSRSTDGGRTWEPMQTIMDMGDDPAWHYDGIGDPAVLVDSNTGTIWVAATWSHGNRSWRGSGPGLMPGETGQFMLVRSDDDGVTWSKPINITTQVKKPEWCFLLQGPGKGITMRDGTLVFAAQYQDPPEK